MIMTHQRWYLQGNQASTDITTRYKGGRENVKMVVVVVVLDIKPIF